MKRSDVPVTKRVTVNTAALCSVRNSELWLLFIRVVHLGKVGVEAAHHLAPHAVTPIPACRLNTDTHACDLL
ncbi:hypothetical protein E2C01_032706 [Portunus trituberculatus]|uniref:Uncharacterized protein n=1 Tax=Portunus trituberculatus TaxID=210409 RepID=A0A5B7EWM2_PORTR|nr:hypothetical protein [Portunus trituberculatus]